MNKRITVPLHRAAHGRTGDKGDRSNISVIAWHPALWPLMASHCLLESLPSLSFLECVSDSPSEAGCDDDACSTVESGYYKTEDNQTFLATMFVWINFCPVELLLPPLLPTAERCDVCVWARGRDGLLHWHLDDAPLTRGTA